MKNEEGNMKALTIALACVLALAAAAGTYLFTAQYQPLKSAHKESLLENEELQRKVTDLNHELNLKVSEITKTKQEKEAEIARVQSTKDSLITQMSDEIKKNQIQITQLADKLKVSIVDKILFPSGEVDITTEGLEVLERVGNILKNVEDKVIRVEGHTDNVPIHPRLQKDFPTNWELSTARATNVVRFLQDRVRIEPERLEAVGLGEFQPVASNDTKEGRSQNRRIEIALLPLK
jgi:chemotaxis protein MotB